VEGYALQCGVRRKPFDLQCVRGRMRGVKSFHSPCRTSTPPCTSPHDRISHIISKPAEEGDELVLRESSTIRDHEFVTRRVAQQSDRPSIQASTQGQRPRD